MHSSKVLSRSYATAVAGVVAQMKYSQETKDFSLLYHTTSACKSTSTEVCICLHTIGRCTCYDVYVHMTLCTGI